MLTVQQFSKGVAIPAEYQANAAYTVGIVNDIFERFPGQFTFSSGYRTPERNAEVGGVANSYHVKALAADFTPNNGNFDQYKTALEILVAAYGWELIDERQKNHFHIEPKAGNAGVDKDAVEISSAKIVLVGLILILLLD